MNRRILVPAALLALIAGVTAAGAASPDGFEPPPFGEHHHGGRHMLGGEGPGLMVPMMLRHASLTPEQNEKVRKILGTDRQTLRKLFTELQRANDRLSEKLFAPGDLKPEDLAPQVEEVSKIRRQLMEQGVKTTLAIRSVLTADQIAKLAQLKQKIDKLHAEMEQVMEGGD